MYDECQTGLLNTCTENTFVVVSSKTVQIVVFHNSLIKLSDTLERYHVAYLTVQVSFSLALFDDN